MSRNHHRSPGPDTYLAALGILIALIAAGLVAMWALVKLVLWLPS